jgi:endonuclease/exonuclease/phosphatase family metal-dependent hydrolase
MAFSVNPNHTNELRIVSYNILDPLAAEENTPGQFCRWDERVDLLAYNLKNSGAKVICLQEVSQSNLKDLQSRLPDYFDIAVHAPHGYKTTLPKDMCHGVAILYDKRSINLLQNHKFTHMCGRLSVIACVQDRATEKVIQVASIHIKLKSNNNLSKTIDQGAQQLKGLLNELDSGRFNEGFYVDDVVIAGDFNRLNTRELGVKGFIQLNLLGNPREIKPSNDLIFYKMQRISNITAGLLIPRVQKVTASDHRLIMANFVTIDSTLGGLLRNAFMNTSLSKKKVSDYLREIDQEQYFEPLRLLLTQYRDFLNTNVTGGLPRILQGLPKYQKYLEKHSQENQSKEQKGSLFNKQVTGKSSSMGCGGGALETKGSSPETVNSSEKANNYSPQASASASATNSWAAGSGAGFLQTTSFSAAVAKTAVVNLPPLESLSLRDTSPTAPTPPPTGKTKLKGNNRKKSSPPTI